MVRWLLILGLLFAGCAAVKPVGPQVKLHESASFPSEFSDTPTLVVFATVWCEPCKKEWPEVVKWAAEGKRKVLYVVSGSSESRVQELMGGRSIAANVRVFVDTKGEIARKYEVQATPTLYLYQGGQRKGPVHKVMDMDSPEARVAR